MEDIGDVAHNANQTEVYTNNLFYRGISLTKCQICGLLVSTYVIAMTLIIIIIIMMM